MLKKIPFLKILFCVLLLLSSVITNAQFIQQAELVGTGAIGAVVEQGFSVAISSDGSTAIVGGPYNNGNLGGVWIYIRVGGVWIQQAELIGTGIIGNNTFQGNSVSISADGNTAIVGGRLDNNGQGAAWVFTRLGGVWTQQTKLVGTGAIGGAFQGYSVSISSDGNTALIGGYGDNGGQGAAWVFTRLGGVWTQQTKLVGTGAIGGANQGSSVAISSDGSTAIVGGYADNNRQGAAWIFTRSGSIWTQQIKLVGTGIIGTANQGISVSISSDGNTAIVGGNDDNNGQGAAWIFTRSGSIWTQQTKLVGTGAIGGAFQGCSVSISSDGNTAIVGGIADNAAQGAIWVYTRTGGVWTQQTKLIGTGSIGSARQGNSVAISSDGSTVIEGGYSDNTNQGAAWIFIRSASINMPNTWLGGATTNWNTNSNWSSGIAPTDLTNAFIPTGHTPYPVLSGDADVDSLEIDPGATVTIGSNTLTINGLVTGTGTLTGSATSNLTLEGNTGTLNFTTGSDVIDNLLLDFNATATLGTPLAIASRGNITVNVGGVLTTAGNLILTSDINGSAQVARGAGIIGGGYINGNVSVERYIPADNNRAWRLLSVPTKTTQSINAAWQEGQTHGTNTVPGFGTIITAGSDNNNWAATGFDYQQGSTSILFYDPSADAWDEISSMYNPIATSSGYFLYMRGDRTQVPSVSTSSTTPTTLRTYGPLYEGSQPTIFVPAGQFGLIGNVYASAIDFNQVLISPNLTNAFYTWDPKIKSGNSLGAYQTFSYATGWTTPISGGSYGAGNSRIESGEAFFVYAPSFSGFIQLSEASKTASSYDVFRPAIVTPNAQLKTNLYTVSGSTIAQVDANFEVYNSMYTDSLNSANALKLTNPGENFAIKRGTKKLVIEARPMISAADTIFYNMWNMQQKQYQLEFVPTDLAQPGIAGYLVDNYLGTKTLVDLTTTTKVSFSVDSDTASAASTRFMMVFKDSSVSPAQHPPVSPVVPEQTVSPAVAIYPNPVTDGLLTIKLTNQPSGNYTVRLVSMTGQLLFTTIINNAGDINSQTIALPLVAQGVYRLELISPTNVTHVDKLIIGKK